MPERASCLLHPYAGVALVVESRLRSRLIGFIHGGEAKRIAGKGKGPERLLDVPNMLTKVNKAIRKGGQGRVGCPRVRAADLAPICASKLFNAILGQFTYH